MCFFVSVYIIRGTFHENRVADKQVHTEYVPTECTSLIKLQVCLSVFSLDNKCALSEKQYLYLKKNWLIPSGPKLTLS